MSQRIRTPRRRRIAIGLYGASASLLVAALVAGGTMTAGAVTPGTDWGPDGVMAATDSAVTVRWDNSGATPSTDTVARDATQVLPHTGGKTYADVDSTLNSTIASHFGDMSLTVAQTTGLRHQAVQLSVTGIDAGAGAASGQSNGLVVMQCWGAAGETAPDPTHCQDGAGMVDTSSFALRQLQTNQRDLVADGDLKAATNVQLSGTYASGTASLVATLYANVFAPTDGSTTVATGATGSIQFYKSTGDALGDPVKVVNGQVAKTVTGLSRATNGITAKYIATSSENYLDSTPSTTPNYNGPEAAPTSGIGANKAPANGTNTVSFTTVGGDTVGGGDLGGYFTATTTNEVGAFRASPTLSGVSTRSFEMQTGAESSGLGCGARSDQASTAVCWIVAIPIDTAAAGYQVPTVSPLTPSLWAQRVQVQLHFAPVASSCGGGTREPSVGSELLLNAMNSWIPALCTQANIDLGYIQTGDAEARSQYTSGSTPVVFTSAPIDDSGGATSTLYAPVALTAVTIGVLAVDTHGDLISGIKLNARLVAKLLTESYSQAIDPVSTGTTVDADVPWHTKLPNSLLEDPEFKALNPTLGLSISLGSDVIVTVGGTDATKAVWAWIMADPQARAFMDGCADSASNDTVINPFYSTRTYAECASDAVLLEATAKSWRSQQSSSNPMGTNLAASFDPTAPAPSYPPTGAAFPQPGYYEHPAETDATTGATNRPALTLADLHPRESLLSAVAADVFRGQEKSLSAWCDNPIACPSVRWLAPGVWYNTSTPHYGGGVLGLTEGSAAARNLLPTALLCDDSGLNCVGANNASLQKAAATFTPSSTARQFLQQTATPDYANGAYPLTLPVYAEINTKGLSAKDAKSYATMLTYMNSAGQQQGYAVGQLPPGVAPLTTALSAQTASAITTLSAITDPTSAPTQAPTSTPTPTSTETTPATDPTTPTTPVVPPVATVPVSTPSTASTPVPSESAIPVAAITPASQVGILPVLVVGALALALIAGIAAPFVGRGRRSTP